jgi:peptide/nickel transport system substrate-binding protein
MQTRLSSRCIRLLFLGHVVFALLFFVACKDCDAPRAPRRDERAAGTVRRLTLGVTTEPSSLCPLFSDGAPTTEVQGLLFRELLQATPSGKVPDLALRIPVLGTDTLTDGDGHFVVSWILRDDAFWSDGVRVTARDVVAGWRVATDPAQATTGGRDLATKIERIEVVDDQRFRVVWRAPEPAFAEVRTHRVLPAHRILTSAGAVRNFTQEGFCRRPVGNGPFVLLDEQPGAFLRLGRNERAVPRPLLDEVVVKIVPSTDGLAAALVAGEVDATLPHGGLSPTEARRVVEGHAAELQQLRAPGTTWVHLDFNLDDPMLQDLRVRQAIAMALDRRRLVESVVGDAYDVDDGFFPRHHPLRVSLPGTPYDPVRAKALLDEAGFLVVGDDPVRVNAQGKPLRLQLAAASGQRETERVLQLVQSGLREVGVDIVLDLRPFKVFFSEGAKKRKLPHLSLYAWVIDESVTGANLWRADRIPTVDNGFTGQNLPGWRSALVTQLLTEADNVVDVDVRKRNLVVVQQKFLEEIPALSFWFRPSVVVSHRRLKGLAPTGTLSPLSWNASAWTVDVESAVP